MASIVSTIFFLGTEKDTILRVKSFNIKQELYIRPADHFYWCISLIRQSWTDFI